MKCGEIWYVSFVNKSVGHEYRKCRPALIIQSDSQLKITTVITIIPFTSNKSNKYNEDIFVTKNNRNNLDFDSVLKVHHIQSFDQSRFIEKKGLIDKEILKQVKIYLKKHFNL